MSPESYTPSTGKTAKLLPHVYVKTTLAHDRIMLVSPTSRGLRHLLAGSTTMSVTILLWLQRPSGWELIKEMFGLLCIGNSPNHLKDFTKKQAVLVETAKLAP